MDMVIKDISIAAYLLATERVHLVKTTRTDGRLVHFHFAPKGEAEKLITTYWSDTALIQPRKLFSSLRSLKDLIFSGA